MGRDTSCLTQVGDVWYLDFTIPARFQKNFTKNRIRHSLNTTEYIKAKYIRDRYLMPIFAANSGLDLAENLRNITALAEEDLRKSSKELERFLQRNKENNHIATLKDLCESFMASYKKGKFSSGSERKIEGNIKSFYDIIGVDTPVNEITKETIVNFRDTLLSRPVAWQKRKAGEDAKYFQVKSSEKTIHPNTVNDHLDLAKRIFKWGMVEGKLDWKTNPADGIKVVSRQSEKHKRPPTEQEIEKLCSLPKPRHCQFDEEAWRMLPLFGRYTGCRIGELALLGVEDVIMKQGLKCLRITAYGDGKSLKTESSERVVPVADKLLPKLEQLLAKHKKGPLFPKCGNWYDDKGKLRKAAHYFIKSYNNAAKKIAPDQSFHCFRAYANTEMAEAGIDILDREAVLGHKSDRVQRAYTSENLVRYKKAVDSIF